MRSLLLSAALLAASTVVFAADQKAPATQQQIPTKTIAPPTENQRLEPAELYALQKASEDVQAENQVMRQKQQVLMQLVQSIQQQKGCTIKQQNGQLACIAEPNKAAAKK